MGSERGEIRRMTRKKGSTDLQIAQPVKEINKVTCRLR